MTVTVTREAESQLELYGAYEGEVLGGVLPRSWMTFTATSDYLIVVPKNNPTYVQLEEGANPSSYIPTTTATVARTADNLTINTFIGYDATEGTFVLRGRWKHNDDATAYISAFLWKSSSVSGSE